MTAQELRDIFASADYRHELEEMSCYLASIKQERPIIYALAKFLWKRGNIFQLEDKRRDLVVDETHLEFKYYFDCDMAVLEQEMRQYGDKPLQAMWDDVKAGNLAKSWSAMAPIYEDMCIRKVRDRLADIFVLIICSRDLSNVSPAARNRICWSNEQRKWSAAHPYSDRFYLTLADSFLDKVRTERPFSLLKEAFETRGEFPSTYHFRICEFSSPHREARAAQ
jgi:hypothetical protein